VTNPDVDAYFAAPHAWKDEMERLRSILLDTELTEELKWRQPCYTVDGGNVAMISEMKAACVLAFFKGALLEDPHGILVSPGEHSRSARFARFTDAEQVTELEPVLRAYLAEAIALEKAGAQVDFAKDRELPAPAELEQRLDEVPGLKAAWDALTPGRRRAYVLYFSDAKQSKTRAARVEKHVPRILEGKGLRDR
jgi:uncharacterized protein YdeI (YjbR/CyaY-like superfamily)